MLQNTEIHKNCFCYQNGKDPIIEMSEFTQKATDTVYLFTQEITFLIKGSAQIISENNNMSRGLEAGDFIFLPIGTRLSYKISENSVILIFRLVENVPECHNFSINRLSAPRTKKQEEIYTLKTNDRMQYFIAGLMTTLRDGLKCKLYMQQEMSRMLFLLHAYYSQEECIQLFSSIISPDMKFSEFIRMNHMKYKNISELAVAMNMSRQQFSNRFKKVFGMNPYKWMQQEKAQLIYQDICWNGKSLKEISYEYNFPLQSNFFRFCKQIFGKSPGEIRKSLNKQKLGYTSLKNCDSSEKSA